jgi:hypothetical protein
MGPRSKLVLHRGRARYARNGNFDDLPLTSWKRFLMRGHLLKEASCLWRSLKLRFVGTLRGFSQMKLLSSCPEFQIVERKFGIVVGMAT